MTEVLIVDDEPAIRESLAFALKRDGFGVVEAASLKEARSATADADLIVLDLVLPDGNGLDFLRSLRAKSDVPVIVLTSRDEETDRVVGLEMGADDYVLKPFSPREVAARVRAVLRRAAGKSAQSSEETALKAGTLSVDPRTRKAAVASRELALSRTEFNLLAAFLRSPGRVFERSQLLDAVWGSDVVVGDRTVDVHIKALRRKIEEAGGDPRVLETVRGVGYRLRDG
ncbi:MAG: response regulator transcription factor [Deltaproteobacteria bacterium]|nr:MAG: response regulator transcription factor [Deltaproteobacteria bacterium]